MEKKKRKKKEKKKKAFLSEQCKEIEENNRMRKTREDKEKGLSSKLFSG